jgi:hypothetical protein
MSSRRRGFTRVKPPDGAYLPARDSKPHLTAHQELISQQKDPTEDSADVFTLLDDLLD